MPRRRATLAGFALALLTVSTAHAQHQHEHTTAPAAKPKAATYPLFQTDMRRMSGMVPADPMGAMTGWGFMTAGVVRFGYNRQGGERGDEGFESTNWFMGMAHHDLGPGASPSC